jgi:uroporphyrin-3 C-methyltransferase
MANVSLPTITGFVALAVALGAAGFVWLDQRAGTGQQVAELSADLGVKGSELTALKARLDEVTAGRRLLDADMDRLRDRVARESEALGELPGRVAQLETSVERFVGPGDKVRSAWLLSEAEHYMRIANAQLGLAADVGVAQTALGLADDALRELNEPRLTPVRRLLAEEINSLKAVPRADTEGIVLSLGSLADNIESLPLKSTAQESFLSRAETPPEALTGLARAMAASRAALASLVSVRRVDDPVSPLLTEAEQTVLLRSLGLELQLARLAIMRGDAGMFRRSVDAASERLREHFDQSSGEVQGAIESLGDLAATKLPEELPDISGSLDLLVRINARANQADRQVRR